ncbi:unnamed protein product [Rhizopus stolonifer]
MLIRFGVIFSAVSLLTSVVNASGQIIQIVDSTNFCTFLPPTSETDRLISDTEWNANAFCMGNTPKATGAEKIPSGFIQSAHYVKTDNYVQITGQIDPSKANLDSSDDGGQYDIKAPNGASCAGWDYFVNLIEPSGNDYCIRCCNNSQDCNRGISEKGCARIVPGDYSGPSGDSSSDNTSSASTTTTTTEATTKSSTQAATTSSEAATTSSASTTPAATSSSVGVSSTTSDAVSSSATSSPVSISSSSSSSASDTTAQTSDSASSSASAPSGSVTDQSVNSAGYKQPTTLVIGAGIFLSTFL